MTPVQIVEGRAIAVCRANIDTDLIIPARHLKTVTREGLGRFAFEAVSGEDSPFADPALAGAPILIAGENFGCGSSREHAVWALLDRGIRAVIAPSFSDIFASNAFKSGLLAVELPLAAVVRLSEVGAETVLIDLQAMTVTAAGAHFPFVLDPFRRRCLLEGLDEIGLTLRSEAQIDAYEAAPSQAFLRQLPQRRDDPVDHFR